MRLGRTQEFLILYAKSVMCTTSCLDYRQNMRLLQKIFFIYININIYIYKSHDSSQRVQWNREEIFAIFASLNYNWICRSYSHFSLYWLRGSQSPRQKEQPQKSASSRWGCSIHTGWSYHGDEVREDGLGFGIISSTASHAAC